MGECEMMHWKLAPREIFVPSVAPAGGFPILIVNLYLSPSIIGSIKASFPSFEERTNVEIRGTST